MNGIFVSAAFAAGLAVVAWAGVGFVGTNAVALAMSCAIAGFYVLGAVELNRHRASTRGLVAALGELRGPPADLDGWIGGLPVALRAAVRLRIDGERTPLPGPGLTPYLVGLLVMLGMLGTFLGMTVTFRGAVSALERSADLQAIRGALAEPIRGLGLSFGTSVAGVAASAMLGLMSAVARRELADAARELDARIASDLRPVSGPGQRRQVIDALRAQADALPRIVDRLDALAERLEASGERNGERLLERQQAFHREAGEVHARLAGSVERSLKDSLEAAARASGESLRPVLETAMAGIAAESSAVIARISAESESRVARLTDETSSAMASAAAQSASAMTNAAAQSASAMTSAAAQSASAMADAAAESGRLHRQAADDARARLEAFVDAFDARATALLGRIDEAASRTIGAAAAEVADSISARTEGTLDAAGRLLEQSEALGRARLASEAEWMRVQSDRIEALASTLRTGLAELHAAEAERGARASAAEAERSASVAAAETERAAKVTALVERLRAATEAIAERDDRAIAERASLSERIGAVLEAVERAATEQCAAIASLTTRSGAALQEASQGFRESIAAQAAGAGESGALVAASAIELASVGESFQRAVFAFDEANRTLVEHLRRVDETLSRSIARSDEQLAYYVAQAREIIDLSVTSQQGIIEDLRRLRENAAAPAEAA